jgi:hypothetical protein
MPMKLRIASVLALAAVLCALPSARAIAGPQCAPCCPEHEASAPGPECGPQDADCCEIVPGALATSGQHASRPLTAPAIACAPRALAPLPVMWFARESARDRIASAPPSRLSVVRLL